jgi:unsaturated rhamnogalacturonyl hydrolase
MATLRSATMHVTWPRCAAPPDLEKLDYSRACQLRWCWCDALFMSPPTFFALAAATGESKYVTYADAEYFATKDYLFRAFDDLPGGLFLRDSTFFEGGDELDENGNVVFWSRGNGWVFAGLPAIIEKLPPALKPK